MASVFSSRAYKPASKGKISGNQASGAKLATLASQVCCVDELQVICAPDHPLAHSRHLSASELVDYEFISREPGSGTREITDAYFSAQGIAPERLKTQMELGSPEALKGVVATGLGFSIVSRAVAEKEILHGTLVGIPLNPILQRDLHLIHPRDRFQSKLLTTFISFARRKLKEQVA